MEIDTSTEPTIAVLDTFHNYLAALHFGKFAFGRSGTAVFEPPYFTHEEMMPRSQAADYGFWCLIAGISMPVKERPE